MLYLRLMNSDALLEQPILLSYQEKTSTKALVRAMLALAAKMEV